MDRSSILRGSTIGELGELLTSVDGSPFLLWCFVVSYLGVTSLAAARHSRMELTYFEVPFTARFTPSKTKTMLTPSTMWPKPAMPEIAALAPWDSPSEST